jgi:hypothetical protein
VFDWYEKEKQEDNAMKNHIIGPLIYLICMLCFAEECNAAWLNDYRGTLGNKINTPSRINKFTGNFEYE